MVGEGLDNPKPILNLNIFWYIYYILKKLKLEFDLETSAQQIHGY